ncbi:MAG TPA: DUF4340 domain-containing protein [Aggregatilineales bacterium]|nr:DUF4340 domain-containing protein [Aggregatilineales bacterium]
MNQVNKALIALVIVQIIAVIVIYQPESETRASGEPLLSDFAPDTITRVQIQDDTGNQITVARNSAGDWVLPEYDDYPVTGTKVTSLLGKIAGLQTTRLITRSETSQRRLKVADDEFMRRIQLGNTDITGTAYTIFLGNAVGGSATHVRVDDEDQVFLVDNLRASDATTTLSSWIDTTYFTVPSENVVSVKVENPNGTFEFSKQGDNWTMTSPEADRDIDSSKISSFIGQITTLRMQEPVSREADDVYGLDTPQAAITIQVQEPVEDTDPEDDVTPEPVITTYTYEIGTEQEDGYIVKSSESDYYVRIAAGVATVIIDKTLDNFLIELPPTPEAEVTEEPAN